ncbi:unnamed protein product [Peniophora sp. CBMAI 1063]|nr:unnamed protein product [Peniophora sp. CBMAI 1063]
MVGPSNSVPQIADVGNDALGKDMRIRIHVEGCRGLPQLGYGCDQLDDLALFFVRFRTISYYDDIEGETKPVLEGMKSLRGTVQWNDDLYLDCLEHSLVNIVLCTTLFGEYNVCGACIPVRDLFTVGKVPLTPELYCDPAFKLRRKPPDLTGCTLFLSASLPSDGELLCKDDSPKRSIRRTARMRARNQYPLQPRLIRGGPELLQIMDPWHTVLGTVSDLVHNIGPLKIGGDRDAFIVQEGMFYSYYALLHDRAPIRHTKRDFLLMSMVTTLETILRLPYACLKNGQEHLRVAFDALNLSARYVTWNIHETPSTPEFHRVSAATFDDTGSALARIVWLIATPSPASAIAASTSPSANKRATSASIAKDTIILVLEAIAQSTDAFPPLKSAASGLMFFVTYAEMASSSKKQIRDIYRRIDDLAVSLQRGTAHGEPISPAHQDAIETLARDVTELNQDLEDIVKERKSRFKRYFSAKRHREELKDVIWQLDNARMNYMTAVATLNATTSARILAHVQAISLVMGVNPTPSLLGPRRNLVTFPSGTSRIEET